MSTKVKREDEYSKELKDYFGNTVNVGDLLLCAKGGYSRTGGMTEFQQVLVVGRTERMLRVMQAPTDYGEGQLSKTERCLEVWKNRGRPGGTFVPYMGILLSKRHVKAEEIYKVQDKGWDGKVVAVSTPSSVMGHLLSSTIARKSIKFPTSVGGSF